MTDFLHKPSGVVFKNRKEAVKAMGQRRYRKALANRDFEFYYNPIADKQVENK